ncbi:MAG: ribonuclease E/G [Eubacteriales bacterium]|nr:ribonuclease E/G [Eubacteriales bacterium]
MDSTRIITRIREGVLADALYEDGRLAELSLYPEGQESLLGNIYVGRVQNVVKNIRAAFVEIQKGVLCYLPLEDAKAPVYTKPAGKSGPPVQGDELLVQVSREAVKTKPPSVTTDLNLSGKYLVLTTGSRTVGYSGKLSAPEKRRLKEWAADKASADSFGMIVRTSAAQAGEEELDREYGRLLALREYLTGQAVHRTLFSCVFRGRPAYVSSLLDSRSRELRSILTDDPAVYEELRSCLMEEAPEDLEKLCLRQDPQYPLKAEYRLEKGMADALSERVWMKSGAYLVIEQVEALTVVDVNTGKCVKGKDKQETIRRINREAAIEIARQMILRNLSGILLVDFVDMEEDGAAEWLLELMRTELRRDPMKAAAVDMTALGLMEITRKKQRKTLKEQAKECGIR